MERTQAMAGLFDWLKGKKGPAKVRGRSGSGKRAESVKRRGAQRRDAGHATDVIPTSVPDVNSPRPEHSASASASKAGLIPPSQPVAAGKRPSSTSPDVSKPPVIEQSKPPTVDPGATQYHTFDESPVPTLVGVLIVQDGRSKDEIYKIGDGENVIGRGKNAQIRTDVRDDTISREHAIIIHESGSFGVRPLKAGANPTFVNDHEVSGGAALVDGDLLRVGHTTLKFRVN